MPVLPLVGSISSLPGPSSPSRSAAATMAAPMRHFTEYAGLRPSILASTRATQPSLMRLSWTRGVRPMVRLLSLKIAAISRQLNTDDARTLSRAQASGHNPSNLCL